MKKSYDSKFKLRVALEAASGNATIAEIAGKYQIHPNLVVQWKRKLFEDGHEIFAPRAGKRGELKQYTDDDLMRKIGQLQVENDFLRRASSTLNSRSGKN